MLESYLSHVLTNYFGHVVENLDRNQVRVSAWNGEVVLENLLIKRDALEQIGSASSSSPVEIVYGRVGRLEMRIPWKLLRSTSTLTECSLLLSDVTILLAPKKPGGSDTSRDVKKKTSFDSPDEEEAVSDEERRSFKEQQVEAIMETHLFQRTIKDATNSTDRSRFSWIRRWLISLLSNLSVTIQNIHIRYEDTGNSMGFVWNGAQNRTTSFAVGVTLRQFSVQTTRGDEEEEHPSEYTVRHKLAAAYQLSIYWDRTNALMAVHVARATDDFDDSDNDEVETSESQETERDYLASAFRLLNGEEGHRDANFMHWRLYHERQHTYLLNPVSPSAQFSLVSSLKEAEAASTFRIPPSAMTVNLPRCQLRIGRNTLEDATYLRKSYGTWVQSNKAQLSEAAVRDLMKIRPQRSPLIDPRSWWKYAFQATVVVLRASGQEKQRRRRRKGWLGVSQGLALRRKYLRLYQDFFDPSVSEKNSVHEALLDLEDDLDAREIVAFRLFCFTAIEVVVADTEDTDEPPGDEPEAVVFTWKDRRHAYVEMAKVLEEGKRRDKDAAKRRPSSTLKDEEAIIVWKSTLACPEVSLQVAEHGFAGRRVVERPIIRIAFALLQQNQVQADGSWEVHSSIASVEVSDLAPSSKTKFTKLICRKHDLDLASETVSINGVRHDLAIDVLVRRRRLLSSLDDTKQEGSCTWTNVRLLPLEAVYSTSPIVALTKLFSAMKIPELVDDYHKMASVVSRWQDNQRKRLLLALAHKRKTMVVDVDVAAPLILIPESVCDEMSPMIVVDLGRMTLRNGDDGTGIGAVDSWKVALTNMQVLNTTALWYRQGSAPTQQNVVESFSLELDIFTGIDREEVDGERDRTQVRVEAVLPRLVFNFSSSSVRLLRRLNRHWKAASTQGKVLPKTQSELGELTVSFVEQDMNSRPGSSHGRSPSKSDTSSRHIEFTFSAPLIGIKIENDVDGRDILMGTGRPVTPIVHVALRGISCRIVHAKTPSQAGYITFEAALRSMEAVDLYQQAGAQFAFLMSSVSPDIFGDTVARDLLSVDPIQTHQDLVSLSYQSHSSGHSANVMTIKFHELFVEWNPETIASIHVAMALPQDDGFGVVERDDEIQAGESGAASSGDEASIGDSSEDEFFDAIESDSQAGSVFENSSVLISEISSGSGSVVVEDEFFVARTGDGIASPYPTSPLWQPGSPRRALQSQISAVMTGILSPMMMLPTDGETEDEGSNSGEGWVPFELSFNLTRFRVNFNRDTRSRRLLSAEMDHTSVNFETMQAGGSRTTAKIGNLTISDPDSGRGSTLYREIVGLKRSAFPIANSSLKDSSLLELEFIKNPRTRSFKPSPLMLDLDEPRDRAKQFFGSVSLDSETGEVTGCDYFVDINFSPMRFVYLQQLWFETIDYFFEGITGYEVWGNKRPANQKFVDSGDSPVDAAPRRRRDLPGADASGLGFTRFIVKMESPVVLVPIAYRSPKFLRLEFESLKVSNFYTNAVENATLECPERVQWYNNCEIMLEGLTAKNWEEKELTRPNGVSVPYVQNSRNATVTLRWPSGPGAPLVKPKWKVDGSLDSVSLFLTSSDYALFQHIIMYNIGEPSRHLDEWEATRARSRLEQERLNTCTLVHFGYDQKDATPTTYQVSFSLPELLFFLVLGGVDETPIGSVCATDLEWSLKKNADLIVHQEVSCDIVVKSGSTSQDGYCNEVLLEPMMHSSTEARSRRIPELKYSTSSSASGDTVKLLVISNACIFVVYPVWSRVAAFFSGLEEPRFWTEDEVSMAMQIGDRWYQIGGPSSSSQSNGVQQLQSGPPSRTASRSHQFRLVLESPKVVLRSTETDGECPCAVLHMKHLDFLHRNDPNASSISKSFFLHDLELYTSRFGSLTRHINASTSHSLIDPWSVIGTFERCIEGSSCTKHQLNVASQVFQAHAAYSDMCIAIEVALSLFKDIRKGVSSTPHSAHTSKSERAEDSTIPVKTVDNHDETSDKSCESNKLDISASLRGFEVLVVDDSLRHFGTSQKLVALSLGTVAFFREHRPPESNSQNSVVHMQVTLSRITVVDCLQSKNSRFRLAASSGNEEGLDRSEESYRWSWDGHSSRQARGWGYVVPDAIQSLQRQPETLKRIGVLTFACTVREGGSVSYDLNMTELALQWNPSTVIALQRFLGRLQKVAKLRANAILEVELDEIVTPDDAGLEDEYAPSSQLPIVASLHLGELTICLNKEHQGRSLLRTIQTGTSVSMEMRSGSLSLSGSVNDLGAWDTDSYEIRSRHIVESNRPIFLVSREPGSRSGQLPFFQFTYCTGVDADVDTARLPSWVCSKLTSLGHKSRRVDDCLSVSMASLEFVYLSERTAELLDYLSNGLPGKGMGLTSKAAKGFIEKRIQTRSFLQIAVDSPRVRVPLDEESHESLILRLGDVSLRSWFEEGTLKSMSNFGGKETEHATTSSRPDDKGWWRLLSVSVRGLGWHVTRTERRDDEQLPVDLNLEVRKPTRKGQTMLLYSTLSYIDLSLRYTDFYLVRRILAKNVTRKFSTDHWDNVEKAYWKEQEDDDHDSMDSPDGVVYAEDARLIRYGRRKSQKVAQSPMKNPRIEARPSSNASVDLRFVLDGLRLKLHRDDKVYGVAGSQLEDAFNYDMLLLRVETVDISVATNSSGERSFHLSLFRLGLFDLGDLGRLARERYFENLTKEQSGGLRSKKTRNPSAFSVLAEGYSPSESSQQDSHSDNDPQLVITIETSSPSTIGNVGSSQSIDLGSQKVLDARVVLNFLTINVLLRPLHEAVSFFASKWPVDFERHGDEKSNFENTSVVDDVNNVGSEKDWAKPSKAQASGFQVKLIAHYPKVFLVADESDPHSRALVLRGLAVLNVRRIEETKLFPMYHERGIPAVLEASDKHRSTAFDAHFHSMESYINSDVHEVLGKTFEHVTSGTNVDRPTAESLESLGVALIEPVTAAIEFVEVSRDRFPLQRNVNAMIEPVSTMLSFEDLSLIQAVLRRLSAAPDDKKKTTDTVSHAGSSGFASLLEVDDGSRSSSPHVTTFNVEFRHSHLGLVLKRAEKGIIVDAIDPKLQPNQVRAGDKLISINGKGVFDLSLQMVVQLLSKQPRPVTLEFSSTAASSDKNRGAEAIATFPRGRGDAYDVKFTKGEQTGLTLARSSYCGRPVVVSVDTASLFGALSKDVGSDSRDVRQRLPLPGAVLARIDGDDVLVNDYDDALKTLATHSNSSITAQNDVVQGDKADRPFEDEADVYALETMDSHSQISATGLGAGEERVDYVLTFVDMTSSKLGEFDTVDLLATGVTLTFIDDFKGRDMPLWRGRAEGIEVRVDRGIGVGTKLIQSSTDGLFLPNTNLVSEEWLAGSIRNVALGQVDIEYYHATIAVWEPLLEPSQLCVVAEKRDATQARTQQVAISVTNDIGVVRAHNFMPSREAGGVVSVTLSDAGAEVIARSIAEFSAWQDRDLSGNNNNEHGEDFPLAVERLRAEARPTPLHYGERAGAQKAAQAALDYAKKRGVATRKQKEAAKPFILRNRSGLTLWFCEEESSRWQPGSDRIEFGQLLHGNDCRFSMEMVSPEASRSQNTSSRVAVGRRKKVRRYDGQFPRLTISFEATDVSVIEPLRELPVSKVGTFLRYLLVLCRTSGGPVQVQIPVLWKVDVVDNRRILTISSSVVLNTAALGMSIELGYVKDAVKVGGEAAQDEISIVSLGAAEPGSPFYLPLWLTMCFVHTSVFVRPRFREGRDDFFWSELPIVQLQPENPEATALSSGAGARWHWRPLFKATKTVRCQSPDQGRAVWLAVELESSALVDRQGNRIEPQRQDLQIWEQTSGDVMFMSVDTGLTLRNRLPTLLQWEIGVSSNDGAAGVEALASSVDDDSVAGGLQSGECVELFVCDVMKSNVVLRLRPRAIQWWTEWAPLNVADALLDSSTFIEGDPNKAKAPGTTTDQPRDGIGNYLRSRQMNLQCRDQLGMPLTLGLRVIPKVAAVVGDRMLESCYGFDLVVYAELWIRNLTDLPLSFGCPAVQMEREGEDAPEDDFRVPGKLAAEAALLEIASVLELGDSGKVIRSEDEAMAAELGKVYLLPLQSAEKLCVEVFEYAELQDSAVKRSWWAAENHASKRLSPSEIGEGNELLVWDGSWEIDCSGFATAENGGWESCRNIIGSRDVTFGGTRSFNPNDPFRRRRWMRNTVPLAGQGKPCLGGIHAFHQPVLDSFSTAQRSLGKKKAQHDKMEDQAAYHVGGNNGIRLSFKCSGGHWSEFTNIPPSGNAHGVVRAHASRWPTITKASWATTKELRERIATGGSSSDENSVDFRYGRGSLSAEVFDLCYQVSELKGDWGEFTRIVDVAPRFLVRNDSKSLTFEIKQAGTPDDFANAILPGKVHTFYWTDFRLPELVSVRPKSARNRYKWSGGFDIGALGMIPLRIRPRGEGNPRQIDSIRALIEIRPGAGASGINVSLLEEDTNGDGALYRIENNTPFPVWTAQDGVLANPSTVSKSSTISAPKSSIISVPKSQGGLGHGHHRSHSQDSVPKETVSDFISPMGRSVYALDVPFRQGKYAGRKAASMKELLRLRISLAPLTTRDGIECTKVIGLSAVGQSVRLNPSKLCYLRSKGLDRMMSSTRILCVVVMDGPTRVLKLMMMEKYPGSGPKMGLTDEASRPNSPLDNYISANQRDPPQPYAHKILSEAASSVLDMKKKGAIPSEIEARRQAFFGNAGMESLPNVCPSMTGTVFSFQASINGLLFSLVDAGPSEIAVILLKDVAAVAKWDSKRTVDASTFISIGWLQVDNHLPSAPFPVAVCPDRKEGESEDDASAPLLILGLAFAPKHKSGILCLRSVTVAPRNLAVAIDLAFIVRLQRFLSGVRNKLGGSIMESSSAGAGVVKQRFDELTMPVATSLDEAGTIGGQKFYFEGMTVLPSNINLSVAPARALTASQAALEGPESAAIHTAVRKGDLLLASGMVGVHVGSQNKTAIAVIRGVFKSIFVDALLRCNGANLNMSGLALRNHITTWPQLMTYLGAHYLATMRSNLPAVLGSLAAFGNPVGLIRGLGDGVSDFVNEPVKGLKRSVQELDPVYAIDGVARGTESLARHTVGGIADSASLLTETLSQNLAVLTLDRRYAQKRDRFRSGSRDDFTFVDGVESGMLQLVRGFFDGVTGVVKAPIRGAERSGLEGFAKGVGKGLLGLLVKPMIGLSDAATDVMIGVRGSVEGGQGHRRGVRNVRQVRPRRPMYGKDKVMRAYSGADAAASTLMLRTRLAGENYLNHLDMGDRVALMSTRKMVLIGPDGREQLWLKFKHVRSVEVSAMTQADGSDGWGIIILLMMPRNNGSTLEVINCGKEKAVAEELAAQMNEGLALVGEN